MGGPCLVLQAGGSNLWFLLGHFPFRAVEGVSNDGSVGDGLDPLELPGQLSVAHFFLEYVGDVVLDIYGGGADGSGVFQVVHDIHAHGYGWCRVGIAG